ncbi:sodium:solute symporter [candidate division KSB1 bacterium]|nr:sodium:solute symporter [candidate division KSB1 bacterium]
MHEQITVTTPANRENLMHTIDLGIIAGYILLVIVFGILLSRRASQNMDSYFLGGKSVPWYLLGLSNASSMFDISGTMWLVYMLFVYGLKGAWMPWMWPTFNQIFFMVYLSIWVRRSNVLTGGEWITTRFGKGKGSELSRLSVTVFALVSIIGLLTYTFQGIGKFATIFFPWQLSANTYAVIFMGITTVYVLLGGMYSVVLTDLIQFILLTITSIVIGVIALSQVTPDALKAAVPQGWLDISFGWHLNLDWSNTIAAVNQQIESDGYTLFFFFFGMIVFKGILNSMAGPVPTYDMQRMLAAKTPKEAALMNGIVSVALVPRWVMVPAVAVLAVVFFSPQLNSMGGNIDFELVLPWVINTFIPVGVTGLLLAGLLAAFMSTFDSTVNCGAAYIVNDLYKKYINPNAGQKTYIWVSYAASVFLVLVGILFGYLPNSINSITEWIVFGLAGGYTAPNILRWHWWRFNGYGYFWGMMSGVVFGISFGLLFPDISSVNSFPFILLVSAITSVAASLMTKADDEKTLASFYRQVRPWGFWQPIYEKVKKEHPEFIKNTHAGRDMTNVMVGVVWQTSLRLIPVFLIVFRLTSMWIALALVLVTTVILKKNWYDKLEED